jgi:hypothetical protein
MVGLIPSSMSPVARKVWHWWPWWKLALVWMKGQGFPRAAENNIEPRITW